MAKTIILFLALFVFVAHCHVFKDSGPGESKKTEHKIEKRSCFVCDNDDNAPPTMTNLGHPPPPPFFRNWNWRNGVDGSQLGPISEASSSANTGTGSEASGNDGDQSAGYGNGGQNGAGFNGQNNFGELGNYKENHNSFQRGYNNKQFGGRGGRDFEGQKQTQSGVGHQDSFDRSESGSASSVQAYGSGSSGNEQQSPSGGFGLQGQGHSAARYQQSDSFNSGQRQEKRFGTGTAGSSQNGAEFSGGNGAGADAGREALKGALNLASKGVETQQASSCGTCDKSNYAISNAKSDSGNAIAVSVGR